MKKSFTLLLLIAICSLFSCIEEIDIGTDSESAFIAEHTLVIEATLTDSLQTQKLILSRSASFANDSIIEYDDQNPNSSLSIPQVKQRPILYESHADVKVITETGLVYNFIEAEDGHYQSVEPFEAETGSSYKLQINTQDGDQIVSAYESLAGKPKFESLYIEKGINDKGEEGLFFYVDSQGTGDATTYFRYNYEETFKIVAPLWSPLNFKLTNYDPCGIPVPTYNLEIISREKEEQICYRTEYSEEIIQVSTENLSSNSIKKFPVYFISKDEYEVAYRYSILVTQYVENVDTYLYYERLKNFSQSANVFYQVQPGFLKGNLHVENDENKLVIGYFSIASVDQKRLFFNYNDYFEGQPERDYLVGCRILSSPESHWSYCVPPPPGAADTCPQSVIELLAKGSITYYGSYDESITNYTSCPGPYSYVPRICGDCTVLGSNVKPDFWID